MPNTPPDPACPQAPFPAKDMEAEGSVGDVASLDERLRVPLTELPAWKALAAHYDTQARHFDLRALFAEDAGRFAELSVDARELGLFADFSKNLWDARTLALLERLVEEAGVYEARAALFAGLPINASEGRAVLHVALRAAHGPIARRDAQGHVLEADVTEGVARELRAVARIAEGVRGGTWTGATGQTITDVVNIGIGGSDLGPAMVCAALQPLARDAASQRLRMHFVANVDGSHVAELLGTLDAARTLFIVVSKTFTTAETLANARAARTWVLKHLAPQAGDAAAVAARHFVAVTAEPQRAVAELGVSAAEGVVAFWDWVGGRFSLWSGAGLAIAVAIGPGGFAELLGGARGADAHFRGAPFRQNVPLLMGVLGAWYGGLWGCGTHAVLPYDQHLARLPAYLQQAEMESNGKGVDRWGRPVPLPTAPVVWGEPGSTAQHAFFQLLHQGTQLVPCDFLVGMLPPGQSDDIDVPGLHRMLVANCLAQTEALMRGKPLAHVLAEHRDARLPPTTCAAHLLPQKAFPGNRPSTTLAYRQLTPAVLGALLACYEHKIFVQGVLWRINSFDQWGVELGKQLAAVVEAELRDGPRGSTASAHDSSTAGLIQLYHRMQQEPRGP